MFKEANGCYVQWYAMHGDSLSLFFLFVCFTQDLVGLKCFNRTQSTICVFCPNYVLKQLIKVWNQFLSYKTYVEVIWKEKG
jgi:hypothetical protein